MFIITQMHGVGLGNRTRGAIVAIYIATVAVVYSGRGWEWLEILRIPGIEFGLAFIFAGLIWLGLRLHARRQQRAH